MYSRYYAWLKTPVSNREKVNKKLIVHIKNTFRESNGIYGYRNIYKDLLVSCINVNKKRVARLMSMARLYGSWHI
ncbi:MAG: IS3 family transposase [Sulfurimonas sp.]